MPKPSLNPKSYNKVHGLEAHLVPWVLWLWQSDLWYYVLAQSSKTSYFCVICTFLLSPINCQPEGRKAFYFCKRFVALPSSMGRQWCISCMPSHTELSSSFMIWPSSLQQMQIYWQPWTGVLNQSYHLCHITRICLTLIQTENIRIWIWMLWSLKGLNTSTIIGMPLQKESLGTITTTATR